MNIYSWKYNAYIPPNACYLPQFPTVEIGTKISPTEELTFNIPSLYTRIE